MKDDVAKALGGIAVLQQWQNQLVQSALRQLETHSRRRPGSTRNGESRRRGGPGKGSKSK